MDIVKDIRIKDILYEVYSRNKSIKYTMTMSKITNYSFPCIIDHIEKLRIIGNTKGKINDISFDCEKEIFFLDLPKNSTIITDLPCNIEFTGITNKLRYSSRF